MSGLLLKLSNDFKPKLRVADFLVIFVHFLVGFTFLGLCNLDQFSRTDVKEWISGYYFVLPLLLVAIFFRNLRRLKFYLIWVVIALIQLLAYKSLKDIPDFQFVRGNAFTGLKALLPTLIVFQFLRLIFFNLRGQEMIVTMRKGRMTMWEEEEKRNMTWIEVVFSMLIMATVILFNTV